MGEVRREGDCAGRVNELRIVESAKVKKKSLPASRLTKLAKAVFSWVAERPRCLPLLGVLWVTSDQCWVTARSSSARAAADTLSLYAVRAKIPPITPGSAVLERYWCLNYQYSQFHGTADEMYYIPQPSILCWIYVLIG